jgi:hypothetical protein
MEITNDNHHQSGNHQDNRKMEIVVCGMKINVGNVNYQR